MSRAGQPSFKMPIKSVTGVERDKNIQDIAERAESISLKPKISDSQLLLYSRNLPALHMHPEEFWKY